MKPKIAILEDSSILLADLKGDIETLGIAEPIICETKSDLFIEKVKQNPDIKAIILDIEIDGSSLNGIAVANILKKPVLFVSGVTKDHLSSIEDIELEYDFPVAQILKPATKDKIQKALSKILKEVDRFEKSQHAIYILINGIREKINQNDIVFLETISNGSNNKRFYFTNRKPAVLNDFSFTSMYEKGYDSELFIRPHTSYRVNISKIESYDTKSTQLIVRCLDENNVMIEKKIPVSENYQSDIKKCLKK